MSKKFGVVIHKDGELSEKAGSVEYTMSNLMAQNIIKSHKGPKTNKQQMLVDYVNSQLGLKYHCTKVLIDL